MIGTLTKTIRRFVGSLSASTLLLLTRHRSTTPWDKPSGRW